MTDKSKPISIRPSDAIEESLCDLCFEDALKIGCAKSEKLKPQDLKETSIRFCVDGLYKWYKSYSKHYRSGSVFAMVRDASWYWASFCETDDILTALVKEYYSLLKDITEDTSYTDLAERMDEAGRVEKIGRRGYPFSVAIPMETHGVISDCAVALGVPFSLFFQIGLGKALSVNRQGLYSAWVKGKFQPLFDEVMMRAEKRLKSFSEIRNNMEFKMMQDLTGSLHNSSRYNKGDVA